MLFHFEHLYIGHPVYLGNFYIFVEAFFALSGFFLARNASVNRPRVIDYEIKEIKKLYPKYLVAFFIAFAVSIITSNEPLPIMKIPRLIWAALPEITLTQMTGLWDSSTYNIGGAAAYISVLLVCSPIIVYLIRDHTKIFVNIVGPCAVVAGYSRILYLNGNLSQWNAYDGFVTMGVIRGMAGISLGALGYLVLVKKIEKIKKERKSLLLVALCMFSSLLFLNLAPVRLIIFPFVFTLFLSLLYCVDKNDCGRGEISKRNKIYLFLGSLSYDIFLLHTSVIILFRHFTRGQFSVIIFIMWIMAELILAFVFNSLFGWFAMRRKR